MTQASRTAAQAGLKNERFGFTIFLSACLHLMIIAGVGFSFVNESPATPAIEITLARFHSDERPDVADFIAQANQLGSGSAEQMIAPATPFDSEVNADVIQEVQPIPQPAAAPEAVPEAQVITGAGPEEHLRQQEDLLVPQDTRSLSEQSSPQEIALAIASLQAQLDLQQQAFANRPRRYTISSASTQQRHDALYLDNWRKHIELVGNQHYPEQARQQEIFGSLRMMVALRPDGSVIEIRILQGSGHPVLDQAAVDIVQLAAPFDPFPDELRGEVDILEIIRTWRFRPGNAFSSQ